MEASPAPQVPKELRSIMAPGEVPDSSTPPDGAVIQVEYARVAQRAVSWGRGLILLGVIQVAASGFLSAGWGLLLILTGLASFLFKDAAMFLVYALTIAWAAVQNFLGGSLLWLGYGVLQLWWAYGLLRDFLRYRKVQADYVARVHSDPSFGQMPPVRAAKVFPWASLALGFLSVTGLVAVIVWAALVAPAGPPQAAVLLGEMVPGLAVMGLAMGLGAFLSNYRFKLAAALGMLGCSLVVMAWLALLILSR